MEENKLMLIKQSNPQAPLFMSKNISVFKREMSMFNYLIIFIIIQLTLGKLFVFLDQHCKTHLTQKLFANYEAIQLKKNNIPSDKL